MKKFQIKANLAEGLIGTISALSVQEKADINKEIDPVKAIRSVDGVVKDLIASNQTFHDEVKRIQGLKEDCVKKYQEKVKEMNEGKSDAEKVKNNQDISKEWQEENDKIQETSEAKPNKMVDVEISEEKHSILSKAVRKVYSSWNDSELYVEAADAVDNADEV